MLSGEFTLPIQQFCTAKMKLAGNWAPEVNTIVDVSGLVYFRQVKFQE